MKKIGVFALIFCIPLFLGLFSLFSLKHSVSPTPSPISQSVVPNSDKLFQLVNEWRVQNGYRAYKIDKRLCNIAKDRADDNQPDYHKGLFDKYGSYPYVLSENIAFNIVSNESYVLDGWLNSPTHLENLKKPYNFSCIVCYQDACVQIFSSFSTDKNNPY